MSQQLKGTYEFEICPEEGLSAQKYLCAECNTPFSLKILFSQIKILISKILARYPFYT